MEGRGRGQLTSAAADLNAFICRQRDVAAVAILNPVEKPSLAPPLRDDPNDSTPLGGIEILEPI